MTTIKNGDWIRASWLETTDGCLSGNQMKFATKTVDVQGRVCHVRGNSDNLDDVRLFVKKDGSNENDDLVIVNPIHVKDHWSW